MLVFGQIIYPNASIHEILFFKRATKHQFFADKQNANEAKLKKKKHFLHVPKFKILQKNVSNLEKSHQSGSSPSGN
jgi:hypothetical protein